MSEILDLDLLASFSREDNSGQQQAGEVDPAAYTGILKRYTKSRIKEMVQDILTTPEYQERTVIVCWSHKQMLELAKELGVSEDDLPDKWYFF